MIAIATRAVHERREPSEKTKTFHVLHELGHFLLHARTSGPSREHLSMMPRYCSRGDRAPIEREANAYAATFLMPRDVLLTVLGKKRRVRADEMALLCESFYVEPWTLTFRIGQLRVYAQ